MAKPAAAAAASKRLAPSVDVDSIHDDRLGWRISLGAHGSILLFILIKSVFFPGQPIPYIPALRVDMVGLPDVLKRDLGKLSKIPAPPEIEKALKEAEDQAKAEAQDKAKKAQPKAEDEVGLKHRKDVAREKKLKGALDR